MADNSNLFKPKAGKSTYKRPDITTMAATCGYEDGHLAVVVIKTEAGYRAAMFDKLKTRGEALQRAHYINANFILRNNTDPLPANFITDEGSLDSLKEMGVTL